MQIMPTHRLFFIVKSRGVKRYEIILKLISSGRDPGYNMRKGPLYPNARRKRRFKWGDFLGITVKKVAPFRCLDGHVKERDERDMVCELDR